MFILTGGTERFGEVEDQLKKVLRTTEVRPRGHVRGGCVSQTQIFDTEKGRVFVKINRGTQARTMFNGEVASLEEIRKTCTVRVPEPIAVADLPAGGALLIMKHIEMRQISQFADKLGEQLADMHLHNQILLKTAQKRRGTIGKCSADLQPVELFGFHTTTCCGYIPQVNDWQEDWGTFFTSQRLQPQVRLIEKNYGDRTVLGLWSELQVKVQNAFKDTVIVPSLLHGDLWEGNTAEDENGPILFDPGSFYGHSECDLSIGEIFGAQCTQFYSAYHRKVPQASGYEVRLRLYQLFHSLNNWNHFGLAFRGTTENLMRCLLQVL
ncbi:PREDICTED: ketosamine-3-kinase-like [Nanorana parkeri]|uniref:ketosamine-3-kinase-like n=1 Tax=Nanorana parkeri TaxID=125878 RepID=UPI000853F1E1|nr:PREDICTED: ketosamine-3-kinase-like [Nanorana parkeri]